MLSKAPIKSGAIKSRTTQETSIISIQTDEEKEQTIKISIGQWAQSAVNLSPIPSLIHGKILETIAFFQLISKSYSTEHLIFSSFYQPSIPRINEHQGIDRETC